MPSTKIYNAKVLCPDSHQQCKVEDLAVQRAISISPAIWREVARVLAMIGGLKVFGRESDKLNINSTTTPINIPAANGKKDRHRPGHCRLASEFRCSMVVARITDKRKSSMSIFCPVRLRDSFPSEDGIFWNQATGLTVTICCLPMPHRQAMRQPVFHLAKGQTGLDLHRLPMASSCGPNTWQALGLPVSQQPRVQVCGREI